MTTRSTLTLLSLALLLFAPAPAQAAIQEIRVAIKRDVSQVNIGSSVNAAVRDSSDRVVGEIQGMNGFVAQRTDSGVALDKWKSSFFTIQPKDKDGVVWIGDKWYRGRVVVVPSGSGLTAVNWVNIEQYLYSVLGGEMNGNWHQEALKSQAVAARTYALHKQLSTRSDNYDVVDTTVSQVYRGIQDESTGTQMAVNATQGQVLTNRGSLIDAVFHSSSGGMTDNSGEIWSNQLPYLKAVQDYDQEAPVFAWKKSFTVAETNNLLGCGNGGTVQEFKALKLTEGGRVKVMEVKTTKGSCKLSGEDIQDKLGLKSIKFSIQPGYKQVASKEPGKAPLVIDRFDVNGNGFGHGLGMSQYGALGMAKKNVNYQQILLHYYNGKGGTTLSVLK
jgi:stage II sporulation protein D